MLTVERKSLATFVDSQEEEKKLDKARQTQQKLEEEMDAWRKRLLQHKRKVSWVILRSVFLYLLTHLAIYLCVSLFVIV